MARHRTSGWLKWLVVLVVLGAGAGFGLTYINHRGDHEPDYRTATATLGELIQVVTATGQLNPRTNVQVGSQVSGIIQKLYADWNSPVVQSQIVAQLDPATYQAALSQAEADLASAKAALELSQLTAKRTQELRKNDLIPQADLETATAQLHQAEATVKIREASVQNAKVNLERTTIYSPIEGVVISRAVDMGQTVAASLAAPTLFVIANDLAKMQIDANVSEADVGGVEVGQEVNFTVDAFPYRTFRGKVIQIRNSPILTQNVVTYDTVIAVNNADLKLKPGMTANVSIVIAQRDKVLKIPNAALRFRPADLADAKGGAGSRTAGTNAARLAGGGGQPPTEGERGGRRFGGTGGFGGPGGPGGEGRRFAGGDRGDRFGSGRARGEASVVRTVYTLSTTNAPGGSASGKPLPLSVKTGISDGVYTEVVSGLKEGDTIVVGLNITMASPQTPTANPFGGGFRRF